MGVLVQYPVRRFSRYLTATGAFLFFLVSVFRIQIKGIGSNLQVPESPSMPTLAAYDAFDFPPIESESIKSVCAATKWDAKKNVQVVFTCDNSNGDIGDVRNSILNCVRYAMLAGGSLVIPRLFTRIDSDTMATERGERKDLDYMFDTKHFVESLRLSCPQLRLYKDTDQVYKVLGLPRTWSLGLFPESLIEEETIPSTGIKHPERWKKHLYGWLAEIDTDMAPTGRPNDGPMIVDLGRSYLTYPIHSDGEGFAMDFGNILKFRSDTRQLATTTLLRMSEKFDFPLSRPAEDPAALGSGTTFWPILENAFFGAHLRAEERSEEKRSSDDPTGEWSDYGKQTAAYFEQATTSNLSVVYVASSNVAQLAMFTKEAEGEGITVVTKKDMLGEENYELEKLDRDQQALVDFLVMLRASQFGGVAYSSFSWNIALKRHMFVTNSRNRYLDGPQMLSDELSQIYGTPKQYPEYAACLWP